MNAPVRLEQNHLRLDPPNGSKDPFDQTVFSARAEARAILWAACEIGLLEAVDVLQAAAETSGLVENIGQDAVQAILHDAFAKVRS